MTDTARDMRMCFACAVNEHEQCQDGLDGVVVCDGCAICNTIGRGPWSCARCGNRYRSETEAQAHANGCTNPTARVIR